MKRICKLFSSFKHILILCLMILIISTEFTLAETNINIIDSEDSNAISDEYHIRVSGKNRVDTSIKTAELMRKRVLGGNKFEAVVLTSANGYADALSGGLLANINKAPILLVDSQDVKTTINYVKQNLKNNGTVYILGGEAAVTNVESDQLKAYNCIRLGGSDRFETNINILKEIKKTYWSRDLLVCSGFDFADAISASSTSRPVLLVDSYMTNEQIEFCKSLKEMDIATMIGGKKAVSENVEKQLREHSDGWLIQRLAGSDRYETSYKVAMVYFMHNKRPRVLLTCGYDFADGLSAAGLSEGYTPVLLVSNQDYYYARKYMIDTWNFGEKSIIIGSEEYISGETIKRIFEK